MAARSAKSRKRKQSPGLLAAGLAATGRAIAERPVGVGGVTAFAITFAFIAANAGAGAAVTLSASCARSPAIRCRR